MSEKLEQQLERWQDASLITDEQSRAIQTFEASRLNPGSRDTEPFVVFKGLSEIFISLGLGFFLMGGFMLSFALGGAIETATPIVLGALSLFLARFYYNNRKMVFPGIVLTLLYSFFVSAAVMRFGFLEEALHTPVLYKSDLLLYVKFIVLAYTALGLILLHYHLTRIPFSVVPIAAAGLVALSVTFNGFLIVIDAAESFPFREDLYIAIIGLAALFFGILNDVRDPKRETAPSRLAFWCHVIAAPALVHTIALDLAGASLEGMLWAVVVLSLAFLLSLIMDRKSFLTSAMIYFVSVLGTTLEGATDLATTGSLIAVFLIGIAVIVMGTWWIEIRKTLMQRLPDFPLKDKMPAWQ
ncbi:hypothetical protein [Kiloniella sp. b19]|uniref:hypothetical protein n=1 Tax=Kiloniella sp. GXU_MW_B19 TaxID=3141326 RepID=UPI0031D6AC57